MGMNNKSGNLPACRSRQRFFPWPLSPRRHPLAVLLLLHILLASCEDASRITDGDANPEPAVEEEPDRTPLSSEEARAQLKDRGVAYSKSSFLDKAGEGDLEVVRLFVEAGMDINVVGDRPKEQIPPWPMFADSRGDGTTALLRAAHGGHLDVVKYLVTNGAGYLEFAFIDAAHGGSYETILYLDAKMDVPYTGGSGSFAVRAAEYAAYAGQLEILKYLLDGGIGESVYFESHRLGSRYMTQAALGGHLEVVQLLAESGVSAGTTFEYYGNDKLGETPVQYASYGGFPEIVDFLLGHGADTKTMSRYLVRKESDSCLDRLQLYDPGAQGCSSLRIATERQHHEVAQVLIEYWMKSSGADDTDYYEASALMYAAQIQDQDLMQALLDSGADPEQSTRTGSTALTFALHEKDGKTVQFLADNGSDVNHIDGRGRSYLTVAAALGDLSLVQTLLDNGADPDARGFERAPYPLFEAACAGELEMVKLLVENGATPHLGHVPITPEWEGDDYGCAEYYGHHAVMAYFDSL